LGTIEEGFISKLKPGNTFWFAGRSLEFIKVKEMTAYVKKSTKLPKGLIPAGTVGGCLYHHSYRPFSGISLTRWRMVLKRIRGESA
jgi:hypothetical protein